MTDLTKRLRGLYSLSVDGHICEDRDFGSYTPRINVEAADHIEALEEIIKQSMRLMKNGAEGAINDTVWSDSVPHTTLYDLMYNLVGEE